MPSEQDDAQAVAAIEALREITDAVIEAAAAMFDVPEVPPCPW